MENVARGPPPRGSCRGLGVVGSRPGPSSEGRARRMLGTPLGAWLLLLLLLPPTGYAKNKPRTQEHRGGCGKPYIYHRVLVADDEIPKKWPWQVSVQEGNKHLCGGSIIASRWILTTANCVNSNITFNVLMGTAKLNEKGNIHAVRVPVKKVIIHPKYQKNRYWSWVGHENNIALLKLVYKVNYTKYIAPVCLASSEMEVRSGSFCWVTGWGQARIDKKHDKEPLAPVLQQAEITVMNNEDCDIVYHDFSDVPSIVRIISNTMLCSYQSQAGDFCSGDFGGPLVCELDKNWYQTGLVSWTLGCTTVKSPGVYTRISEYSNWIAHELKELNSMVSTLKVSSWITPLASLLPICLMMAP